jgi:hypothetical protein
MIRSGAIDATQTVTGALEYFSLYTEIDITQTGNYADPTQKDLESIIQVIGLRAMPVLLGRPVFRADLSGIAPTLTGSGWQLNFGFERESVHTVSRLVDELNGIVLNGGVISTTGDVNTEFEKREDWL